MGSDRAAARFAHPFGQPVTQVVLDSLADDAVRVEGDDARHLAASLRLAPGDTFIATDGRGQVARLEATAFDRKGIDARILERRDVPAPALRLWLVAEAEGARGDWIVEKAVELGAFGFCAAGDVRDGRVARWRRLARAALKQSLSAHELRIEADLPARALAAGLASAPAPAFAAWIAHPEGRDPLLQPIPAQGDLFLVCGPPGGFSAPELAAWEDLEGAARVGLGPLRLRAETAALALLAVASLRANGALPGRETS
jgi:16S rRNA (uracil1498-N3)-methyltransferase